MQCMGAVPAIVPSHTRHEFLLAASRSCMHAHRSMRDLWDEEHTDACRAAFINGMYKPAVTPSVALSDGRTMPILGVSTWLTASVQATVEDALRSGCRCASAAAPCLLACKRPTSMPSTLYTCRQLQSLHVHAG